MIFVGDIHGQFETYYYLIGNKNLADGTTVIQVGDHGLFSAYNFSEKYKLYRHYRDYRKVISPNIDIRFVRGNHDNPEICRKDPKYLGDFSYSKNLDMMFISGAWSIDWMYRTSQVDWWTDEELCDDDFENVIAMMHKYKPRWIVSHDCPAKLYKQFFGYTPQQPTRTGHYLNRILEECPPTSGWIFGHHHHEVDCRVNGVRFVCCDINEVKDILIPGQENGIGDLVYE